MRRLITIVFVVGTLALFANGQTEKCSETQKELDAALERLLYSGSEGEEIAYNRLKTFIDECGATAPITKYRERFREIAESRAQHLLSVAKYYLKLSNKEPNRSGLNGAFARLKSIRQGYPEFSGTDEVLYLLGKIYIAKNELDSGEQCFRELLERHSLSPRAAPALRYLSEIDALRLKQ